jgi:hypothetical protein
MLGSTLQPLDLQGSTGFDMSYDPIRSRIIPGLKTVLSRGGKYNIAFDPDDTRGNEYIELTVEDSVTAAQVAGAHGRRVTVLVDYHSNSVKKGSDAELHTRDVIEDLLNSNPFHRSDSGLHQWLEGEVSNVDPFPGEDDKWKFRITFDCTHVKVY